MASEAGSSRGSPTRHRHALLRGSRSSTSSPDKELPTPPVLSRAMGSGRGSSDDRDEIADATQPPSAASSGAPLGPLDMTAANRRLSVSHATDASSTAQAAPTGASPKNHIESPVTRLKTYTDEISELIQSIRATLGADTNAVETGEQPEPDDNAPPTVDETLPGGSPIGSAEGHRVSHPNMLHDGHIGRPQVSKIRPTLLEQAERLSSDDGKPSPYLQAVEPAAGEVPQALRDSHVLGSDSTPTSPTSSTPGNGDHVSVSEAIPTIVMATPAVTETSDESQETAPLAHPHDVRDGSGAIPNVETRATDTLDARNEPVHGGRSAMPKVRAMLLGPSPNAGDDPAQGLRTSISSGRMTRSRTQSSSHSEPDYATEKNVTAGSSGLVVPFARIPGSGKRAPKLKALATPFRPYSEPQDHEGSDPAADDGELASSSSPVVPLTCIPGGAVRSTMSKIQATLLDPSAEAQHREEHRNATQEFGESEAQASSSIRDSGGPVSLSGSSVSRRLGLQTLRDKIRFPRASRSGITARSGSQYTQISHARRQNSVPTIPSPLARELSHDSTGSQDTIHTVEAKLRQACHQLHCLLEDALVTAQQAVAQEGIHRQVAHQSLPHGCHRFAQRQREARSAGRTMGDSRRA